MGHCRRPVTTESALGAGSSSCNGSDSDEQILFSPKGQGMHLLVFFFPEPTLHFVESYEESTQCTWLIDPFHTDLSANITREGDTTH